MYNLLSHSLEKGMSIPGFMKLKANGLLNLIHLYLNLNATATLYDLGENTLSPYACIFLSTK